MGYENTRILVIFAHGDSEYGQELVGHLAAQGYSTSTVDVNGQNFLDAVRFTIFDYSVVVMLWSKNVKSLGFLRLAIEAGSARKLILVTGPEFKEEVFEFDGFPERHYRIIQFLDRKKLDLEVRRLSDRDLRRASFKTELKVPAPASPPPPTQPLSLVLFGISPRAWNIALLVAGGLLVFGSLATGLARGQISADVMGAAALMAVLLSLLRMEEDT